MPGCTMARWPPTTTGPWPRSRAVLTTARTRARCPIAVNSWLWSMRRTPARSTMLNGRLCKPYAPASWPWPKAAGDQHNQKPVDIWAKPCCSARTQGKAGEGSRTWAVLFLSLFHFICSMRQSHAPPGKDTIGILPYGLCQIVVGNKGRDTIHLSTTVIPSSSNFRLDPYLL
jgi:hypothetical protein